MKVLSMDNVSELGLQVLRDQNFEIDVKSKLSEDELIAIIGEYDAMIVRSATKVTAKIIEAADNLKIIGRAGVGVDNIDIDAATKKGIIVVNSPDGNTIAATEHTMAMMLALARNIPQAVAKLKEGQWLRKEFTGIELRGKTLGILGLGRIGSAIAKRARAFEMDIIAYDPFVSQERAQQIGARLGSIDDVLREADIITVHMPKNKDTIDMINKDAIAKMKDGVRILNVARGGIVNEQDLYDAIVAGKVAGAALDVYVEEPKTDSPLFTLDKVVATPHLGASTKEAQINVAIDVAQEISSYLQGGSVRNAVNMFSFKPGVMEQVQPYLGLAEQVGRLIGYLSNDNINKLEIIYDGAIAEVENKPINISVVKGLLDPILDNKVNFVNALSIAKERGIETVITKQAGQNAYNNLLTVKAHSGNGIVSVAGTLFGAEDMRIVAVNDFSVDVRPCGDMLIIPHVDRPNLVGKVGSALGNNGINISSMQVGRHNTAGEAIMIINTDGSVEQAVIDEIAAIDGVLAVNNANL